VHSNKIRNYEIHCAASSHNIIFRYFVLMAVPFAVFGSPVPFTLRTTILKLRSALVCFVCFIFFLCSQIALFFQFATLKCQTPRSLSSTGELVSQTAKALEERTAGSTEWNPWDSECNCKAASSKHEHLHICKCQALLVEFQFLSKSCLWRLRRLLMLHLWTLVLLWMI